MSGIGTLIAEVPVHLEHLGGTAHQQLLQIQLRSNAQVEAHVVGVDVGGERASVGTAVNGLQHRGLDLEVTPTPQRLPHRADHLGAQIQQFPCFRVDDEIHVPLAHPRLRVGEALVLVGQRHKALGGHDPGVSEHRQLAALGGDHLTDDPHLVAEVHQVFPLIETLGAHAVLREHDLQIAGGIAKFGEHQFAGDAVAHHPAGDGYGFAGSGVSGEFGEARPDAGDVVVGVEHRGVGILTVGHEPVELLSADPLLFRQRLAVARGFLFGLLSGIRGLVRGDQRQRGAGSGSQQW